MKKVFWISATLILIALIIWGLRGKSVQVVESREEGDFYAYWDEEYTHFEIANHNDDKFEITVDGYTWESRFDVPHKYYYYWISESEAKKGITIVYHGSKCKLTGLSKEQSLYFNCR